MVEQYNMRTDGEVELLVKKFKRDVVKRKRWFRVLLALDQLLNVVWLNGSQDETVSSHLGRKKVDGTITWFQSKVCCFLRMLESKHCLKSRGE